MIATAYKGYQIRETVAGMFCVSKGGIHVTMTMTLAEAKFAIDLIAD